MNPLEDRVRAAAGGIRRAILKASREANRGHIGSALSVADLVAAAVNTLDLLRVPAGERDRFVLSKGHAALAYYAALEQIGVLEAGGLDAYCRDGSRLAQHPDHRVPGISFSTGSLGQGVSYGVGSALAARLRGSMRRTVVLASDGELNCGVTWEALMFAAHHRLGRFHVVIDHNGSQAFGATRDVVNLNPIASRLRAFDFIVDEIDGHDAAQILEALDAPAVDTSYPRATVARTRLGHGVSFMEGRLEWHYLPMTPEEYGRALLEVETACDRPSSPR